MNLGSTPFAGNAQEKMFEKIVGAEVKLPKHLSSNLRSIIMALLKKDASKRIGCGTTGSVAIKSHKWFEDLDFSAVYHQTMPSPYQPFPPRLFRHREEPIMIAAENVGEKKFADFWLHPVVTLTNKFDHRFLLSPFIMWCRLSSSLK